MRALLERLKLVDYLTTEIPIEKRVFVERLRNSVDPGGTGFLGVPLEAFRSTKNEYKGVVTDDSFKIRRRKRMFDSNLALAKAEGTFRQKDEKLIITSTITGFNNFIIPFLIFILIFYLAAIVSFAFFGPKDDFAWVIFPFILVHAAFMVGIPYFVMRRSVAKLKYDLERDFFFMTKEV
ncbi:MAG TPA: hypothetical protein VGD65_23080 [Chryseosolibacter sp.]